MTSTPQPARVRHPWWRAVLRDPVLLIACVVLAVVAVAAAALTAVDRTAARVEAARAQAAAQAESAARAEAAARVSVAVPPPLSGGAPPDRSAPVAPASCPASGAVVLAAGVDAAMGLRAMGLELVNCGRGPYTVRGYPEVRVLSPAGTPLAVEIIEGPSTITALPAVDDPPERVTLKPGQRATAALVWRATAIAGPADRVASLEVTGRTGDEAQVVTPDHELDLGTGGRLGVGPWTAGPGD